MQKILDIIIGEDQSTAIKKRTLLHTLSTMHDMIDVSNKMKLFCNILRFSQSLW